MTIEEAIWILWPKTSAGMIYQRTKLWIKLTKHVYLHVKL